MLAAAQLARDGDVARLERALERDPALARKAQVVVAAAQAAQLRALQLLVERGADPNTAWRGYRPLHALIQERPHGETEPSRERIRCLKWLLRNGADPEQHGAWPPARAILVAAFMGSVPFVDALRAGKARIDGFVSSALGDLAAVRRTLGMDKAFASARDSGGLTALQCCAASRMGRDDPKTARRLLEVAMTLLDAGADASATTKSWDHDVDATYLAVGAGNEAMLDLLLERGGDATEALCSTAWREGDELSQIALRHGADVNRAIAGDRPLLNELVRWGQVGAALRLLSHGADPNRTDPRGWTALHQAASRGNKRMMEAILAAGGDPKRKDRQGNTPADVARGQAVLRVLKGIVRGSGRKA